MIHQIQFTSSIPERGIDFIEGYYTIEGVKAHIFIPVKYGIDSWIPRLDCQESRRNINCQFINCRLAEVGSDIDEYIVETAILGETASSYQANAYKEISITFSNDLLRFLNPPWDFTSPFSDKERTEIKFQSLEKRNRAVIINDNIQLVLKTGYTQSYSSVRYIIQASALFEFQLKDCISRESVFELVDSIIDYYSLFFDKPLTIQKLQMVTQEDILVEYWGDKLSIGAEGEYFANKLIDEGDIENHLDHLKDWINHYAKNKIAMNLVRDGARVSDEQLKFICYTRCMEVFHKENFITSSKPPRTYYEDLHEFATRVEMSDEPLKEFVTKDVKLIHRILDLIRSVYDLIIKERLMFGLMTGLNRAQEIVDTRNYLIHFTDAKKDKAIKMDQLPYRNYALLLFIRVVILKHFCFDERTIKSLIAAGRRRVFG